MEILRERRQHSHECTCLYGEFKRVFICADKGREVGPMGTSSKQRSRQGRNGHCQGRVLPVVPGGGVKVNAV